MHGHSYRNMPFRAHVKVLYTGRPNLGEDTKTVSTTERSELAETGRLTSPPQSSPYRIHRRTQSVQRRLQISETHSMRLYTAQSANDVSHPGPLLYTVFNSHPGISRGDNGRSGGNDKNLGIYCLGLETFVLQICAQIFMLLASYLTWDLEFGI